MSDIHGSGFGDSHDWKYASSNDSHNSFYRCTRCGQVFVHHYNTTPDIFVALEEQAKEGFRHITDRCPVIEISALRKELETERMRLVACGVIAMANTPDTAARARDMHPDYRCASVNDVANAVDREMALRKENEALRGLLTKMRGQWIHSVHADEARALLAKEGEERHDG